MQVQRIIFLYKRILSKLDSPLEKQITIIVFAKMSNGKCIDKLNSLLLSKENMSLYLIRESSLRSNLPIKEFNLSETIPKRSIFVISWKFFVGMYLALKMKPDIIISYYLIPHGIIGNIIGKIVGIPTIVSMIGSDLSYLNQRSLLKNVFIKILSMSNLVLVTGTNSKETLKNLGIKEDKIRIMANTIDVNKFSIQRNLLIKKDIDLIFVGRFLPVKRIDRILRIMYEFQRRFGRLYSLHAYLVGDGVLKSELMAFSQKLNLTNVDFVGYKEDIIPYMTRSKILLLTSLSEGFPATVLEAMSMGIVPVVGNVGDITDIIKDGENGFIIKEYNYEDIAELIFKLLKSPGILREIAEKAIETSTEFSYEKGALIWKNILYNMNL